MNNEIRNAAGKRIGFTKEESEVTAIYDSAGHRLGEFRPKNNQTFDQAGHMIGWGNQLMLLLPR
jgi:YD repeat-containing protein